MPTTAFTDVEATQLFDRLQDFSRGIATRILPPAFVRPNRSMTGEDRWPSVYWLPDGLPKGESIFLASSRLGTKPDEQTELFDALRTLACRLDGKRYFLLSARGTALDQHTARISELFGIPLMRFEPFPRKVNRRWLELLEVRQDDEYRCFYVDPQNRSPKSRQVYKDKLLIQIAKQVRVLFCRPSGNVCRSVTRRIDSGLDTRVLQSQQISQSNVNKNLIASGATAWILMHRSLPNRRSENRDIEFPRKTLEEIDASRFLIHWTRRRVGKWPDQTHRQYLDDLIFGTARSRHDPLSALCRILATNRIIASNRLTRDPANVVCLSNVGLDRLPQLSQFRPHLGRWDFLPFGIAIDRFVAKRLGARPVIYGSEADWETLAPSERPFFQIDESKDGRINWRQEQEWRLIGDLPLAEICRDQAVLFVPDESSACIVGRISRWPVVVLSPSN